MMFMDAFATLAFVLAGFMLGGLYFGGLWWTILRLRRTRFPFQWYFGSLLVRLAVVMSAFYGILTGLGWTQLAASLVGFLSARLVLTRIQARKVSCDMRRREACG